MNDEQLLRYSRQILLPEIGAEGQLKLAQSRALIIGVGGLGSPAAMYLAAAGIGALVLSDPDQVELSNLQRQIIHRADDIGELKAHSAQRTLAGINPQCRVTALDWQLDDAELAAQVGAADVVLDCCDNFATRFAVNRACVAAGTPLVSGAAIRMEGQIASFLPEAASPCYECIYPGGLEHEETCAMEGVLAPLVGVLGSLQAMEALTLLSGFGEPMRGALLVADLRTVEIRKLSLPRRRDCPNCGHLEN